MANILVIDDDNTVLMLVCKMLDDLGHTFQCASDGREGVIKSFETKPDLILVDLVMPDMDGLEAIMTLHGTIPGLKIIAMTAGVGDKPAAMLSEAFQVGANATLCKPFDRDALMDAIDRALEDEDDVDAA